MFMGIFRSKLSPIYWLIRFFGKDLAKNSEIDEAHFRMMILPGAGYDMRSLLKEGKAIFVNILGIPKDVMEEAFSEYNRLAVEVAHTGDWYAMRQYKVNTFLFEVTEEEHDKIVNYLSGKKVFVIANDELARIRTMAAEDAQAELRNRKFKDYLEKSMNELEQLEAVG